MDKNTTEVIGISDEPSEERGGTINYSGDIRRYLTRYYSLKKFENRRLEFRTLRHVLCAIPVFD